MTLGDFIEALASILLASIAFVWNNGYGQIPPGSFSVVISMPKGRGLGSNPQHRRFLLDRHTCLV